MSVENIYVGFELRRLTNLIKREFEKQELKNINQNFTHMHGLIISYIFKNKNKDIFQRDIEEAFTIRRSTASNILHLMEDNKLITKTTVPYDARLKKIILTDTALEIHSELIETRNKVERKTIKDINDKEIKAFFKVIKEMQNNLDN